MAGKQHVE